MPGDYRDELSVSFATFLRRPCIISCVCEVRMSLLRKGVRVVAAIVVVYCTFSNFLDLSMGFSTLGGLPPREAGSVETFERLFLPIRDALYREKYDGRNLGYVTVRSPVGQPRDMRDDIRYSELRYVVIPFSLIADAQGAPYVIGDYTENDQAPESLEGYTKVHDEAGKLVLYKKVAP